MTQFHELTDRYALEKILKSTRAGTVLRARDGRTGQPVAIKQVNVTSPALLVQKAPELERLGNALGSLREPALPVVTDFGFSTEGTAFLVMELLDGKPLDGLAGSPRRLLGLLFQTLEGLEALARGGLVHHNLSPDNLLVVGAAPGPEGAERVKILGLGSALFQAPGQAPAETARFRAPELDEPGAADGRADLYSFALVACQVLGIALTAGDPPSAQMPFALSLELADADALARILERCLRRDPDERPSHQEVREAFRQALGEVPAATTAEPRPAGPRLVVQTPAPGQIVPAGPIAPAASAPPLSARSLLSSLSPQPAAAPLPAVSAPKIAPEPEASDELLPSIDDDFLDSLTGPPAAAPAGAQGDSPARVVPFPGGRSAAIATQEAPPSSPVRRSIALIAVAGFLIAGAAGTFWWLSRDTPAQEATAAAPEASPLPPRRPATEVLAEAQKAMADEDWPGALAALQTLNAADQASLPPAGCRTLTALEETLSRVALERLPQDLAQGLKTGDLARLRFAATAATGADATLSEGLRADLERARGVLDLYAGIEEAAGREAHTEVLERFAVLEQQLPAAKDPGGLRTRAAAALEAEAENLARTGTYEDALVKLEPVLRTWKGREEATGRAEVYRRARQRTAEQEELLAVLPAAERRRKPHEGLERLEGVEPVPHLAARFADLRTRLTDQLGELDRQPPQITLRDGFFLDYDRGRVVELSFRVTDDYQVRGVKLMARPEGGKMREMPLDKTPLGYTVEITPDFHRNGTVELYVVATDSSGHEGFFGTRDQPKRLQRRQGFEQIVQ